jgi:hypothetical protein
VSDWSRSHEESSSRGDFARLGSVDFRRSHFGCSSSFVGASVVARVRQPLWGSTDGERAYCHRTWTLHRGLTVVYGGRESPISRFDRVARNPPSRLSSRSTPIEDPLHGGASSRASRRRGRSSDTRHGAEIRLFK